MKPFFEQYDLPCEGCSNEPTDRIPLARVVAMLDRDYAANDLLSAEKHLAYWKREAVLLKDLRAELTLCNEEIGLCRRTNARNVALADISRAEELLTLLLLDHTVSCGTICLNIATTLKHFGEDAEALRYYERTESLYRSMLSPTAYEYAALYNNKASALEALGRYDEAELLLNQALVILDGCPTHYVDKAISYVNLARLVHTAKDDIPSSEKYLSLAWEVLTEAPIAHDGMYAFVCTKAAEVFAFFGKYEEADALYEVAQEIYEGA